MEKDNNVDLAHTENPTRQIKPPQRDFSLVKVKGETEHSTLSLYAVHKELTSEVQMKMAVSDHGEGVFRIKLWKNEVPASWAVRELPEKLQSATLKITKNGDVPQLQIGSIQLSGWKYHPEALRFSIECKDNLPRVYGLGEKMGRLERSGRVWDMWNTDEPEHVPSRDPLYVSIPFAILSVGQEWFGVFIDNPARQYWDTALNRYTSVTIDVEDEYIDMYLIQANSPREVLQKYTMLTGSTPMPPVWGLGYHQSRYSYYPEDEVRRIAQGFRKNRLPADVLQLDIDYMDGYRIFTWNKEGFPDPEGLIEELRNDGFKVVTIVDPGIKVDPDYYVYKEGMAKDYFSKLPDGKVYQGAVWPGKAVYPDFSRSKVRTWWADLHKELFRCGVSGIWNDMNEPADFTGDPEYRPDYTVPNELQAVTDEGSPVSFKRFHNLYSMGMNKATRAAFAQYQPEKRGFVITRSGYAGLQRDAGVWTGDNCSWWEHLDAAVPMLLGLSISGVSMVGSDTGGFQEDASAQLYARWFSFAAFTPYFRSHTADDTRPHEPWSFGQNVLDISRHYLQLRYSLLPYIYTAFFRAETEAEPVMKPLFFDWPQDKRLAEMNDEYLFGQGLLIAPVTKADALWRHVYLPEGKWYDFWDDTTYAGGHDYLVAAPIGKLPLFVRGGSIIPHEKARMHTSAERNSILNIDIYPDKDGKAAGELYIDAEEGWGYRRGEFSLIKFSYNDGALQISFEHEGFCPPWEEVVVSLHNSQKVLKVSLKNETADPLRIDSVDLPSPFAGLYTEFAGVKKKDSTGTIAKLKLQNGIQKLT